MKNRPALRALAERAGILAEYVDQEGTVRPTSDVTRVALLAAMGWEADTETRARAALRAGDGRDAARVMAPSRVVTAAAARTLPLRPPRRGGSGPLRWQLDLRDESGASRWSEGSLHASARTATVPLPPLAPGYYDLRLHIESAGAAEWSARQTLVVTPGRCALPSDVGPHLSPRAEDARKRDGGAGAARERDLGASAAFGLLANLYTVRSARNWGAGDVTDLCDLVSFAGKIGAAFVGINPLHALGNVDDEVSPYSPLSRLYRNVLYLDVTAVPELLECAAAQARLARTGTRERIARLRAAAALDYERVHAEKDAVLRELHRTFMRCHRGRGTARDTAYTRYRDREGERLIDFATFVALRAHLASGDPRRRDPRHWPKAYRDPRSPAVARFRAEYANEIDYRAFLQFELERQLATVADRARTEGLRIGVYQDLALGSSPAGSDPWAFPGLFVGDGTSIGAPPDPFAPDGQNWGLPPIDPVALAADGYRYWIALVRAAFRHSGALRIDHVMGLFRQFWIPAGLPGSAGAYVRMPADDFLGILALESARAGALVIGEDLGTVPVGLPRELARRGILSMRVLYFERDTRGAFRSSRSYRRRALTVINTHDLAPLAGFWKGRDLVLRRRAGQIATDDVLAAAERARETERRALVERLRSEGLLRGRRGRHVDPRTLCAAVHSFLGRTPSLLVGVALDDLAGEVDPVNLPGVALDVHPSWRRKMRVALDELTVDGRMRRALGDLPALRGNRSRAKWKRTRRPGGEASVSAAAPSAIVGRARKRARDAAAASGRRSVGGDRLR